MRQQGTSDARAREGEPEAESDAARCGRPLNLRQIEVFQAIMQAGSVSGAGRMLHVSQLAVSRVLALTESRLGYPLFERARGKLLPTPEARRLHAEVEQVYGGVRRVNALATALRREGAGTLRVVASAAFAQQLVPRALAHLRAGGVPTRIDYRSVTFDELVGCFLSGRVDVGVSMVPAGHASVASTRLGRQPLVCILPQDHPLAGRAVLTPEDFAGTAWIGYPQGTPLGRAVARFFGERAVHCAPAIEYIPRSPRARSCSKGWVRRWWMRGA